jgi:hypothetical protein
VTPEERRALRLLVDEASRARARRIDRVSREVDRDLERYAAEGLPDPPAPARMSSTPIAHMSRDEARRQRRIWRDRKRSARVAREM